jgi:hypothetical protein
MELQCTLEVNAKPEFLGALLGEKNTLRSYLHRLL